MPFNFSLVYATATQECRFHAAYFDVVFTGNYGSGAEDIYTSDVAARVNVIVQLDSILRHARRQGKLEHFIRWQLNDHYHGNVILLGVRSAPGAMHIEGRKIHLSLIDSVALNNALKKLWHIKDVVISPNKKAGMWLYSLHVGFSKTRLGARPFHHGGDFSERPDRNLLWLKCEGGFSIAHHWYQHETDGYYHQYTGLYLTRKNVLEAQRLLLIHRNLKTTIVSQYITSAIIKKYAFQ
ncbi:hypothetical protein KAX97_07430 [candidate division WOR-3 bacterium]|nr:hypothetical protein [candidate division WOR-3 bacterium]